MSNSSVNIVDITVLVLLLGSILSSYHSGFIKLVLQKFSFFGGVLISFIFTSPISTLIADLFQVRLKILDFVTNHINDAKLFSDTAEGSVTKAMENLNNLLDEMSILGKFTSDALQKLNVTELVQNGQYFKDELIEMLVNTIEVPVLLIIDVCVFFVLLLLGMLLCGMVSNILGSVVNSLPLIGTADHVLGGLFGILSGVAWGVIFVVVYSLASMFITDVNFISIDLVESSMVGQIVLSMFSNIGL